MRDAVLVVIAALAYGLGLTALIAWISRPRDDDDDDEGDD